MFSYFDEQQIFPSHALNYLVPSGVLGTPGSDVDVVSAGTARAGAAVVTWAVAAAGAGGGGVQAISLNSAGRRVHGNDGEQSDEEKVHV